MRLRQSIERWLLGQRFVLRTALSEEECKRRIAQYSTGLFPPPVTKEPAAVWKGNKVYVWVPYERRGPWVVARMRATGDSTEIDGRAGVDFANLWGTLAVEAAVLWAVLTSDPSDPVLWGLLLLPIVYYLVWRNSPHGEHLIDFLAGVLAADDVLARKGDPIVRV